MHLCAAVKVMKVTVRALAILAPIVFQGYDLYHKEHTNLPPTALKVSVRATGHALGVFVRSTSIKSVQPVES